jgi:hypothetical protein
MHNCPVAFRMVSLLDFYCSKNADSFKEEKIVVEDKEVI